MNSQGAGIRLRVISLTSPKVLRTFVDMIMKNGAVGLIALMVDLSFYRHSLSLSRYFYLIV